MKKIFIVLIVLKSTIPLLAQPGLRITAGATVKTMNNGFVVLNNVSLINDGLLQQAANSGTIKFTGNNNDSIKGAGSFLLDRIYLSKSLGSLLTLRTNILVNNEFYFNSGLFNLDNYVLDLDGTGVLNNENETSRAISFGTGYIQATKILNAPNAINTGNLGAIITSTANLGSTIIRRGHAVQTGINGSGNSIQRYYDITPTNNTALNAILRFRYFDAELNGVPESSLSLWRNNNNSWASLGSTISDVTVNYVEKRNISGFFRMTLAQGCPNIIDTIPDVYAVNPGGAANTIYIGYGPTSLTLVAQVIGGTRPYSYKWTQGSTGGTVIGTDSALVVNPPNTGTYTYYLAVSDAYGCKAASISKTIAVKDVRCGKKLDMVVICQKQTNGTFSTACVATTKVSGYLSNGSHLDSCHGSPAMITIRSNAITETEDKLTISVYPNPSSNYFSLIAHSSNRGIINVNVTDILGRLVETRINVPANAPILFGKHYRPGVYFIEVIQGNNRKQVKLIKQSD